MAAFSPRPPGLTTRVVARRCAVVITLIPLPVRSRGRRLELVLVRALDSEIE
jgi:hypothetical protein